MRASSGTAAISFRFATIERMKRFAGSSKTSCFKSLDRSTAFRPGSAQTVKDAPEVPRPTQLITEGACLSRFFDLGINWPEMRSPRRRQLIRACWPALALLAVDCQRPATLVLRQVDNADAGLSSIVYTGDPNSAPQLVRGFFEIEDYSWRWTAQRFSVGARARRPGATGESATLTPWHWLSPTA